MTADFKRRRLFVLPQLDKPTYDLLQELRRRHEPATQWEVISAALVAFGQRSSTDRAFYLADFRGKAPSDTPPHEVQG